MIKPVSQNNNDIYLYLCYTIIRKIHTVRLKNDKENNCKRQGHFHTLC